MAGASKDQALSLLATANNHGDLAVKLSSLKQAKDILRSIDPSSAAELFPYLVELQSSPETLVRKSLIQTVEDIGLKAREHCSVLMPILLVLLKDGDSIVSRQSIITGTYLFRSALEDMVFQFNRRGKVERWLEELWLWMVKFKDAVFTIAMEPGSVGTRLLALKFLETYALLFTSDTNDSEKTAAEVAAGSRRTFNISWLVGGHPILEPYMLMSEANRTVGILLNLLQSASILPGPLAITVVNCMATIARKRPVHYSTVLSALLDFENIKVFHAPSILFSLRSAFLGFLRCTNPAIIESRDRLLRALRAMNAGDAADQVIRQVDKLVKNTERASRDVRMEKEDQFSSQLPVMGDLSNKRHLPLDNEDPANIHEGAFKRIRPGLETHLSSQDHTSDFERNKSSVNGQSLEPPMLDGELTPAEQMIAMIGALLAEGERGAESLEILISKIQPDLLADIVITNMRHLPKAPPPLTRLGSLQVPEQTNSLSSPAHVVAGTSPMNSLQPSTLPLHLPLSPATTTSSMVSDTLSMNILPTDSKRDPRRAPRRLDPRRIAVPSGLISAPIAENSTVMQPEFDGSISLSKPNFLVDVTDSENPPIDLMSRTKNDENLESKFVPVTAQSTPKEEVLEEVEEPAPAQYVRASSDPVDSPVQKVDEDTVAVKLSDELVKDDGDTSYYPELDQHSPILENAPEDTCHDLPELPSYVELTEEQEKSLSKLALRRIIESYKQLLAEECSHMRLALLARLVAQITSDDDFAGMLEKHIVVDYQQQKGHELVLHVLYHLHSLTISGSNESSSSPAILYEKFILAVAKSLLDSFPASDKSFSRLFGEVPILPDSAFKLLDDLCYSDVVDQHGKSTRDIERVTQGLGAVWSLILGHPQYRQACLDIALKCAVHSQDEIRAKAIRLVANKLYQLIYISESIENFATQKLLSAVDHHSSDTECLQPGTTEPRAHGVVGGQEASVSDSQISESENSENDVSKKEQPAIQGVSVMPLSEVQRVISLYFALCTKKPRLLQLVFNTYGRAPKIVKQAFHRHIPILIRALGSSYSELLHIISDPPQGSENLLMLVLQVLTQEMTPSSGLISTVKHLYETKLKDVSILIPMLSSLSKNEVLPIFPQLVALPLEKFQKALAHILQGSAHTGPALSPTEVLVAIHSIVPEKDGLPLKKITDACSACFEQRTVFTQQVLAKSLTQMVDQTPLPLLFMRTVIQAIDAFPSLVDFVMEILSKLVRRQIWKMPKLWVGFLKCVSQTQPHSFHVLLQLPLPQLESALSKYANLRGPLAAYARQPNVKSSLARSTLAVLGLTNETLRQSSQLSSSFHPSDSNPSANGATTT